MYPPHPKSPPGLQLFASQVQKSILEALLVKHTDGDGDIRESLFGRRGEATKGLFFPTAKEERLRKFRESK